MIRLAKRMATTSFSIGMAIGLVVTMSLHSLAAAARLDPPPPSCVDTTGQPQEIKEFVQLQCQVQQTIFGDGCTPGMVFGFDKDIAQPGKYAGVRWDGAPVTFEATLVVDLNIKENSPPLYAQGVIGLVVVGRLTGPAGTVPISGAAMRMGSLSTDTKCLLGVASILSEAEFDLYVQDARIRAGVRVLDVQTFVSHPLGSVTSAAALSGSPDDLATLFGNGVNTSPGGIDVDCVKRAYDRYNEAMKLANDRVASCVIDAVATFAIAMALCAIASFFATPLILTACCLAALANLTRSMARCIADHQIAANAAKRALQTDMAACGVTGILVEH